MYTGNSSVTDIILCQTIFLTLGACFIFAKCKSKIIHNHYKAVIMDKAPYEFDAIFPNRLSDTIYVYLLLNLRSPRDYVGSSVPPFVRACGTSSVR